MSSLIFILGGARSGKSDYALELARRLAGDGPVLFIATAQAGDAEMAERIARHRCERPGHWQTLEAPLGVGPLLQAYLNTHTPAPQAAVLDCVTLLISNLLFAEGEPEQAQEEALLARVNSELDALLAVQKEADISLLMVSNEVGLGIVPAGRISRLYRDLLGRANRRLVREADYAYLLVAGIPLDLKALQAASIGGVEADV